MEDARLRRAKIARAKNRGGAAGGGAAPEQTRPKAELKLSSTFFVNGQLEK